MKAYEMCDELRRLKTDEGIWWCYRSPYGAPFSCDWMSLSDRLAMDKFASFLEDAPNGAIIKGIKNDYERTYIKFGGKWKLFKVSHGITGKVTPRPENASVWDGWKWTECDDDIPQGTIIRFVDSVFQDGTIKIMYCIKEGDELEAKIVEYVYLYTHEEP